MDRSSTTLAIPSLLNRRRCVFRSAIVLAAICLCACQSTVLQSLKQPNPDREAQLQDDSRVQEAFDAAGLQVQMPNRRDRFPRYRYQTQYTEIYFTAIDAQFALDLAPQADSIYGELKAWFQFGLPYRVKVRIEPTGGFHSNRMKEITGLAGGRTFYLNSAANPNRRTFAHELTHIFFFRQKPDKVIPWWLNEGLAEYVATENRDEAAYISQIMRQAGEQEELLHLGNLPASESPLWQSYRAAATFFLFLHEQYGEAKIRLMVKHFMRSTIRTTVEDVVVSVYEKSLVDLETEWREMVLAR